eukprot:TRINITY_DN2635_c0_g1_i1.p1 TRINITY_DN2635_c0_g1~~TRINITY_DN2635_c0_g1_i1.p1  ORF type:complete len:124 (-),score=33.96 TRINITY_DN2635_c0_g1_i1:58-429(-)
MSMRVMKTITALTEPLAKDNPSFRHGKSGILPSWAPPRKSRKRVSSGGSEQSSKKSKGNAPYRAPGRGNFRSISGDSKKRSSARSSSSSGGRRRDGGGKRFRGDGKRFRGARGRRRGGRRRRY